METAFNKKITDSEWNNSEMIIVTNRFLDGPPRKMNKILGVNLYGYDFNLFVPENIIDFYDSSGKIYRGLCQTLEGQMQMDVNSRKEASWLITHFRRMLNYALQKKCRSSIKGIIHSGPVQECNRVLSSRGPVRRKLKCKLIKVTEDSLISARETLVTHIS